MTFHVACSYCLSGRRYLMQDGIAASQIQQSDLRYAGFTPNVEKCNWEPRQIGEWLSMIINNITMCFMIPPSKIKKSKLLLNRILAIKSACHLSRYCTRNWFHQFLSACSRICDPTFHKANAFCHHAASRMGTHSYSNPGLAWRVPFLAYKHWSFRRLSYYTTNCSICRRLYTDASGVGYWSYTVSLGTHIVHGHWDADELRKESSTYRELKATFFGYQIIEAFVGV